MILLPKSADESPGNERSADLRSVHEREGDSNDKSHNLDRRAMVRLSDLPTTDSEHLLSKDTPEVGEAAWQPALPLRQSTVALLTTAGLTTRDTPRFDTRDATYRVIPGSVGAGDLVMSHASVNFDRTAYQQDLNTVFPIDRLRELAARGEIQGLSNWHYAFMGAYHEPAAYEASGREVGRLLRNDGVDAVLLVPI